MTFSRISRRFPSASFAFITGCALILGSAFAQEEVAPEIFEDTADEVLLPVEEEPSVVEEGPTSILPPVLGGPANVGPIFGIPAEANDQDYTDTSGDPIPADDSGEPIDTPQSDVTVIDLDQVDYSGIGVVDENSGGFAASVWRGSDRAVIVNILSALPDSSRSPTGRRLLRNLLLTSAAAPSIRATGEQDASEGENDFLRARIARLQRNGFLDDVVSMVGQVPPNVEDAELTRLRVDTLLLSNSFGDACQDAKRANQQDESPYWLKVVAYCRVLESDRDGAAFAADVLREMGVDDPLFYDLIQRLSAFEAPEPSLSTTASAIGGLTPLKLSMLRTAKIGIPIDTLSDASPLMLNAIATTPGIAPELSLEAGQRAAKTGALAPEGLANIYGGAAFTEDEFANALVLADAGLGARGEALVFQAVRRSTVPSERESLLKAALRLSKQNGSYVAGTIANSGILSAIEPSTQDLEFVKQAVRALLVAGDVEQASIWYETLRIRAEADGSELGATSALLELWPLMQVAGAGDSVPWSDNILELWWQSQLVETRAERARKGQLLFAILEAFDQPIGAAQWNAVYDGAVAETATMPPLVYWRGMMQAAQSDRVGEAVLLALAVIGDNDVASLNPAVLSNVLRALRAIGLEREARALALEAAILGGI